ncbi:MAG: hypothetical protein QNK37_29890 [Acidobacteriota bacterium]|nr:hypothetical protein [Acidobacteriota bacterium]
MSVKRITSDAGRIDLLEQVTRTAGLETGFGSGLLPQYLVNRATAVKDQMIATRSLVNSLLATRRNQVEACGQRVGKLESLCRAVWTNLSWRVRSLNLSGELLKLFGLPLDGSRPVIHRKREWLTAAEGILNAEQTALDKGYPPMDAALIAALTAALEGARDLFSALDTTNHQLMEGHTSLDALRAQIDGLAKEIRLYLNFALAGETATRRRTVMRSYGYTFTGGNASRDESGIENGGEPAGRDDDPVDQSSDPEEQGGNPTDQASDPVDQGSAPATGEEPATQELLVGAETMNPRSVNEFSSKKPNDPAKPRETGLLIQPGDLSTIPPF